MDFNVSEYEKFTDAILDSTLKLTFKTLSLITSWYNIKKHPQFSEKAIMILLPF